MAEQLRFGPRTCLTLLILFHLFAIFVAISANSSVASGFQRNLRSRTGLSYYLDLLRMDLGYDVHHTRFMQDDFDHACDIVLNTPKGFRGDDEQIARQQLEVINLIPEDC